MSLRQSRKGFMCHALIDALLPVSPDAAFSILTDPEVKQWRQVKVRTLCLAIFGKESAGVLCSFGS